MLFSVGAHSVRPPGMVPTVGRGLAPAGRFCTLPRSLFSVGAGDPYSLCLASRHISP